MLQHAKKPSPRPVVSEYSSCSLSAPSVAHVPINSHHHSLNRINPSSQSHHPCSNNHHQQFTSSTPIPVEPRMPTHDVNRPTTPRTTTTHPSSTFLLPPAPRLHRQHRWRALCHGVSGCLRAHQ